MINGWLIYREEDANKNKSYIEWFLTEAKKQQVSLKFILREHINIGIVDQKRVVTYQNKPISLPNFAVVRTIEPLLSKHLELLGINVFNSASVAAICNHKARTYSKMNELGVPIVNTIFANKADLKLTPPMTYPFVVKESTGRSGKQVFYVENKQQWDNLQHQLTTDDLVIQSAKVQLGKDVRVFVIGNEIIGAVLRKSKGDFRANFNLGGSAKWYPLQPKEQQLILKIITAFRFDLVGIDFLVSKDGHLLFNEIEDVVGSRILSAVSDINLLQRYVSHIKVKLNKK